MSLKQIDHNRIRTRVIGAIAQERRRQVSSENYTPARDDEYTSGELAEAAAAYALLATPLCKAKIGFNLLPNFLWPWPMNWYKPKRTKRNLVRAAALIVAELERLERAAIAETGGQTKSEE